MKWVSLAFCCFLLVNCGPPFPKAEDALDAGREFIDGCLKGDFRKANFYMLQDSANEALLKKQEKNFMSKSGVEREQYKTASIIINEEAAISDSVHVINYQNSYDNVGRKVKVIFSNNKWLVDFKYTFNGNL